MENLKQYLGENHIYACPNGYLPTHTGGVC